MANFILLCDPDAKRRAQFAENMKPLLSPVPNLITGEACSDSFLALWAVAPCAPVQIVADDDGSAVIWGEMIDASGQLINVADLRDRWKDRERNGPAAAYDGFHAVASFDRRDGLTVSADLLGLFPVYYYSTGSVLLAGSSPELFRRHPSFQMEFNPAGLVGILLTNGLFQGRTLLCGVHRLSAGCLLRWNPGDAPREVRQYKVALSTRYCDLPFSAHVDLLDRELDEAFQRHAGSGEKTGLLLSGGLDSRMLAGYCQRNRVDPVTFTFGLPSDTDMRCAMRVARSLAFDHYTTEVSKDRYVQGATITSRWEHLANGFYNITDWIGFPHLGDLAPRFIMGALADAIVGGSTIDLAYCRSSRTLSFDKMFERVNSRAIAPTFLKKLLRPEIFGELIDETIAECRTVYEGYSDQEAHRAFCFGLDHRERFLIGSMAWVCSFSSWPVLPVNDRKVLELVAGMPAASLAERRLQNAIMCTRFARLSSLPLDRNSDNTSPLILAPRDIIAAQIRLPFDWIKHRLSRGRNSSKLESRYYYRIWDLNNPGWRQLRHHVEELRELAGDYFNRDAFDAILPGPNHSFEFRHALSEASAPKLLLGFLLWIKEHS